MDVWLLPTIAERMAQDGWATLRFNFRGVEGSGGSQTAGALEGLDVTAAVSWLATTHAGAPLAAVGWSFGAMMALRAGAAVGAWVGIAPPTRALPDADLVGPLLPDPAPAHRTVVVGDHDQFFPPSTVGVLAPHDVVVLPDADHFLFDRDHEVADVVAAALSRVVAG